jgi:hypothetical protein
LPVFLVDRGQGVIGALHAGWRGVAAGILEEGMAAAPERGSTPVARGYHRSRDRSLLLEVGPEVAARFDPRPSARAAAPGPTSTCRTRLACGSWPPASHRRRSTGRALHRRCRPSALLGPRRRADRPHGGVRRARGRGEQPAIVGLVPLDRVRLGERFRCPRARGRPTRARNAGSRASSTAIADMPATSPGSRRNPLTPSTITSGMPPIWVAITEPLSSLLRSATRPKPRGSRARGRHRRAARGLDVLLLTGRRPDRRS